MFVKHEPLTSKQSLVCCTNYKNKNKVVHIEKPQAENTIDSVYNYMQFKSQEAEQAGPTLHTHTTA